MDWNNALQIVLTFIASMGGAGIVLLALITWVGRIWENTISVRLTSRQNRELEALKNEYSLELERLRAEVARQRDFMSNISTAISTGYMATHPHIVDAIRGLWSNVLEVNRISSTYFLVHDLLPGKQVEQLTPEYAAKQIYISRDDFDKQTLELASKSEIKRPFIGERLWTLYYVYRAFAFRICLKMHITQEKSGKIYAWNKDEQGQPDTHLFDTLKIVLAEDELNYVRNIPLGAPSQILNLLKSKILSEMNELVFGKRMLSMSIEEQQKVEELLPKSQAGSRLPNQVLQHTKKTS